MFFRRFQLAFVAACYALVAGCSEPVTERDTDTVAAVSSDSDELSPRERARRDYCRGEYTSAVAIYRRLLTADSELNAPQLLNNRGAASLMLGRDDEALRDFRAATEADGGLLEARYNSAGAHERSGDDRAADRELDAIASEGRLRFLVFEVVDDNDGREPQRVEDMISAISRRLLAIAPAAVVPRSLASHRIEVAIPKKMDVEAAARLLTARHALELVTMADPVHDRMLLEHVMQAGPVVVDGKIKGRWVPLGAAAEKDRTSFWDDMLGRGNGQSILLVVNDGHEVTDRHMTYAQVTLDSGKPGVFVKLSEAGGRRLEALGRESLRRDEEGRRRIALLVGGEVRAALHLGDRLGKTMRIATNFTEAEAQRVVRLIEAGSLPAQLKLVREESMPHRNRTETAPDSRGGTND